MIFGRCAQQSRPAERKAMIYRDHDLLVSRQAQLLSISRGSVCYLPRPVSSTDMAPMRRIDDLHLDYPFAGARMLRDLLAAEAVIVWRLDVSTQMMRMGIEAIYRKPNTSRPAPGHMIYPYLLRKLPVIRPNQVWAMEITYIPMARGFVYLAAVVDWFSRRVLSFRLSISLDASFCRLWADMARPKSSTPTRGIRPVHQHGLHHDAARQRYRHHHGRQGIVEGQL
jgi:putative transposase